VSACLLCDAALDPGRAGMVLFEDERLFAVLHEDWAVAGHAMLVWKGHRENVSELKGDEAAHFMLSLWRMERAILEATGAGRAILMKLGIQVPHLHLHLYPVSRELDRLAVMNIVEGRVADGSSTLERAALAGHIRRLL
jgi:diadenosine tetraphosphate (Ap4A) HIT family hydrolase